MKTKARLLGMQAYSWRQYKVGLCMSDMLLKAVFWDLDGTLIDSEPYWHEGEMEIAAAHGGYWDEDLAWSCSGTPLDHCAKTMIEHGTNLPPEQIAKAMVDYVAKKEFERVPWTNGVLDVLGSLVDAGIPSVLVTTSPRRLAQNVIDHAPAGAFAGFVCGDDDLPHKPDPATYLAAAKMLGIETGVAGADGAAALPGIARCVALEDSATGIASAVASGATTIAQLGFNRNAKADGPQCASIDGFAGITAEALNAFIRQRLGS